MALSSLIVAMIASPYIIAVIVLFFIFGVWLFKYAMVAYKETYRLETTAFSSIISYFTETFSGLTVIRSFE